MSEALLVSVADRVATVTINRPDRRNALNGAVLDGLVSALDALSDDPDAHVIVITGAGERAFCAGGDLGGAPGGGFLALHDERGKFVEVFRAMARVGKPIIARVNGAVRGGGVGLLLGCDLAVAADDVTIGTPEIRVGLFPMMIMTLIFRNIGRKKAMELMLTGEAITAPEAERLGMLNRTVPRAQLDTAVAELAGRIATYSPAVLKLGRDAIYQSQDMDLWQALEFLRSQLTINTLTEDAAEGISAFLSKRKPEWKGR